MKSIPIIITALLVAPALNAGVTGILKPGASRAPLNEAAFRTDITINKDDPRKAPARPDFYGVMLYSDVEAPAKPDLKKFRAGYSPNPASVMTLTEMDGCSGTYADDKFMFMDYSTNSSGNITAVNWNIVDVEKKQITATLPQNYAVGICMDMTYDITTGKIYGISALSDVLVSIDPATGEADIVAPTLPFYTLSADTSGTLYGIALDTETREGVLYTVNKLTGAAMKIGSTGVKMLTDQSGSYSFFQTAAFSSVNGTLYWATTNSDNASALYSIDITTGKGGFMAAFPDNQSFVSLFDIPQAPEPDVPGQVSDASIMPSADGTSVAISFRAPEKNADGETKAEISTISIFKGSAQEPLYSFENPEPGADLTWTDPNPTPGFNVYRIIAENSVGQSLPVYISTFCGEDYPEAPSDIAVITDVSGYPVITWNAPEKGLNGLDINPAKLKYNIIRDINGTSETVGEGITATTFTDNTLDLTRQLYPYYYVVAVSEAGEGRTSAASGCYTGPAYQLPFTETFKDCALTTSPWIMQSIALGGEWELNYVSTFPGSGPYNDGGMLVFIGFRAVDGAQARIATPLLDFSKALNPELKFHFYYLDMSDQDLTFDDKMVIEVSADSGEFIPVENATFMQHDANTRWTECTVPLKQYAGKNKVAIGFHGYSAGGFDLLLDNIRVVDGTSAITQTEVESNDEASEFYTVDGCKVIGKNLNPGLYIEKTDNKSRKVLIRH